jgi:hypothetical protein
MPEATPCRVYHGSVRGAGRWKRALAPCAGRTRTDEGPAPTRALRLVALGDLYVIWTTDPEEDDVRFAGRLHVQSKGVTLARESQMPVQKVSGTTIVRSLPATSYVPWLRTQ